MQKHKDIEQDIPFRITQLLFRTGFQPNWLGFRYLQIAIGMRLRPEHNWTKLGTLCKIIADENGKTHTQVNSSMRLAITKAYEKTKTQPDALQFWEFFCGYCPTVLEYISLAAEWIRCRIDLETLEQSKNETPHIR